MISPLWRKRQQFVAVKFILFLSGFDFGRQARSDVIAEGIEAVKDGNDALLFGEGRKWNLDFVQVLLI